MATTRQSFLMDLLRLCTLRSGQHLELHWCCSRRSQHNSVSGEQQNIRALLCLVNDEWFCVVMGEGCGSYIGNYIQSWQLYENAHDWCQRTDFPIPQFLRVLTPVNFCVTRLTPYGEVLLVGFSGSLFWAKSSSKGSGMYESVQWKHWDGNTLE
jgi:hypothetical protein